MACKEFYYESLNDLDHEMQTRITNVLHDTLSSVEEISNECENIINDVEKKHGMSTFTTQMVTKKFALIISKKEGKNAAISFLNRKLDRFGKDDLHTLITMAAVYDKNGEYGKSIQALERAMKVVSEGKIEFALLMLKLAADHWNHEAKSKQAFAYQMKGINALKNLHNECLELKNPSTESGMMFIDAYKTAAYVYRIQNMYAESYEYCDNAYKIIKKCPRSKLQHLKCLSRLCVTQAKVINCGIVFGSIAHLVDEAMEIGEEIVADDEFMTAHVDIIIHVYSSLAHATDVVKERKRGLTIRLKSLECLRQYQGEFHPEVARVSADVALGYYFTNDRDNCDEYIDLAEEILDACGYKEDISKSQLYIREISDTYQKLADLFTNMREYGKAEENFEKAINLHIKVYGENHQRTSKLYRFKGKLYSKWGKKSQAAECFNKAIEIAKLYLPATVNAIKAVQRDLDYLNSGRRSNRF